MNVCPTHRIEGVGISSFDALLVDALGDNVAVEEEATFLNRVLGLESEGLKDKYHKFKPIPHL